jgi:hypothetical protein
MAKYDVNKYVVRFPWVFTGSDHKQVPLNKGGKIDWSAKKDTGPLVWCNMDIIDNSKSLLETGIISGDCIALAPPAPHKHADYDEIFTLLGTNPKDPLDLGADCEFYLGEGKDLEKVIINRSTSVYVPAGTAHFPLLWRNVKRPCIFIAIACTPYKIGRVKHETVDMTGRPTSL